MTQRARSPGSVDIEEPIRVEYDGNLRKGATLYLSENNGICDLIIAMPWGNQYKLPYQGPLSDASLVMKDYADILRSGGKVVITGTDTADIKK